MSDWASSICFIVRDLLRGPKRYTDLQEGLPGIGPNVLAGRLRSLESAGQIRKRRLPAPAASTVYELTESGASLQPILEGLFEWGLQFAGSPKGGDAMKASWWLPAIRAAISSDSLPPDTDDTYELRIGEEVMTIHVKPGEAEVHEGAVEHPDLVLSTDQETFALLGRGGLSPLEALE